MVFVNVDAPGNKVNRRGVRTLQKLHAAADRKAAAQAKRDRRRAKRAGGPNVIVFHKMRPGGLSKRDPDGAYVWGGAANTEGRYQIAVAGPLKASVDEYVAALARWVGKPMRLADERPLERPVPDETPERSFHSIVVEPDDGVERGQIVWLSEKELAEACADLPGHGLLVPNPEGKT